MAIHSNILALEIPWTEEPGGLQSIGSQRVRHDRVTKHTHKETTQAVFESVKYKLEQGSEATGSVLALAFISPATLDDKLMEAPISPSVNSGDSYSAQED